MTISESELLAELRKATAVDEDVPADAMTVRELCDALGVGLNVIQRKLTQYRAAGRLGEYRVYRYDAQGRPHRAAAYVLLPATAGTPKRKRA